jgi:hypothetical protein
VNTANVRPAGPAVVSSCYRLILGRDPDPEGLRVYSGLPVDVVVRSLIASPEYLAIAEAPGTMLILGHEFVVPAAGTIYVLLEP